MYRVLATILLLLALTVCWIVFGPDSAPAPSTSSGSSNELRNFRIP